MATDQEHGNATAAWPPPLESIYRRSAGAALRGLTSFDDPECPSEADRRKARLLVPVDWALQAVVIVSVVAAAAGLFWMISAGTAVVLLWAGLMDQSAMVENFRQAVFLTFGGLIPGSVAAAVGSYVQDFRSRVLDGIARQSQLDGAQLTCLEELVRDRAELSAVVAVWLSTGRALQMQHVSRVKGVLRALDRADAADRAAGQCAAGMIGAGAVNAIPQT